MPNWPGGIVVIALDLRLKRLRVRILAVPFSGNNLGQVVVHTHVPLSPNSTIWYRSRGRWCPAAGKATVDLASHWPCVTDQWFINLWVHVLRMGDEHPTYTPLGVWYFFINMFPCVSSTWLCLYLTVPKVRYNLVCTESGVKPQT